MERRDRPVVTLFWGDGGDSGDGPFTEGGDVQLTGDPVRHAHVRRVSRGEEIRILDGNGRVASGHVELIAKDELTVRVDRVRSVSRPVPLDVIVPVADRDRMLLAAEKCVELQVTSWQPAYFARSRSVTPRGEGPKFRDKVRARMQAALEQSGGAWMPSIQEEAEGIDALRGAPTSALRLLLDIGGKPLPALAASVPTVLAVGPEGGLEQRELAVAMDTGWTFASLGTTTLRFETAVLAAAAIIRATQLTHRSS